MRTLFLTLLILLTSCSLASSQVPPGADSLANSWTEITPTVQTFEDEKGNKLYSLGDSTWVAIQDTISIGCELGPNGEFWVTQPMVVTEKWVTGADTTLQYTNLQATYECIDEVQWLWRQKENN